MLEIKPFSEWSASTPTTEPTTQLKDYTDYVRASYFKKDGAISATTEQEIANGVQRKAFELGIITEEDDEETANGKLTDIYGTRTTSKDADAQFILSHLERERDDTDAVDKANTLRRYLVIKETQPQMLDSDPDLLGIVDTITGDRNLVRDARMAALDRGDVQVVAVDEEGGRQVYAGPNTNRETVTGKLDSLLSSGAITSTDLGQVGHLASPNASGRGTIADDMMFATFANTLTDLADKDEDLATSLRNGAEQMRRSKQVAGRGASQIGYTAGDLVVTPFTIAASAIVDGFYTITGKEKPAPGTRASAKSMVRSNSDVFRQKGFSEEQIENYTKDYILRSGGSHFDGSKPETGIETDSLGNVVIANGLVPNKPLFETALENGQFTEGQKEQARQQRLSQLNQNGTAMRQLILGENSDAISAYAQAKSRGLTDGEFVEEWVSDPDNYSGFMERSQQLAQSTFNAVATIGYGIASLVGDEGSAKMLGVLNKELSDREEYMSMFGDSIGFTGKVIMAVPQVGVDILATIGTGGIYKGVKVLGKAGAAVIKNSARNAVSSLVSKESAGALRMAATAGGEATTGTAFRSIGAELAKGLTKTEAGAALFATSYTRSAGMSYGSIYSQLPETMSHEDKHKHAVGYAVASGLSTAIIVTAMMGLGRGGVESFGTRALTKGDDAFAFMSAKQLGQLTYKQAKALYDDVQFAGKSLPGEFQKALRANVGGAYKNYVRTVSKGFVDEAFEEALDQAISIKIEDAALGRETPLSEQLSQIFEAGMIGGILGGVGPSVSQFGRPVFSDLVAAEGARMDLYGRIAKTLRETDSKATAAVVERKINEGRTASMNRRAEELMKENERKERAKVTYAPNAESEPFVDAGDAAPVDPTAPPAPPTPTDMVGDHIGERASMEGFSGTLQVVDGNVVLQLDEAVDGNTFFEVGPAQLPLNKSGLSLTRKRLSVLKQDKGNFPAGTPFVNPYSGKKGRYALSPDASTVEMWRPSEGEPYLRVRIAKVDGNQESFRWHTITDSGIIQDVLKYYRLTMPDTESDTPVSGARRSVEPRSMTTPVGARMRGGVPEAAPEVAPEVAPVAAPIRKKNGEPFTSETTARAALKRAKLDPESYTIVPVEGGFEATLKVVEPEAVPTPEVEVEQPPAQTPTPEVESAQPSAQSEALELLKINGELNALIALAAEKKNEKSKKKVKASAKQATEKFTPDDFTAAVIQVENAIELLEEQSTPDTEAKTDELDDLLASLTRLRDGAFDIPSGEIILVDTEEDAAPTTPTPAAAEVAADLASKFDKNEPFESQFERTKGVKEGDVVAVLLEDGSVVSAKVVTTPKNGEDGGPRNASILVTTGRTQKSDKGDYLVKTSLPRWRVRLPSKSQAPTTPTPAAAGVAAETLDGGAVLQGGDNQTRVYEIKAKDLKIQARFSFTRDKNGIWRPTPGVGYEIFDKSLRGQGLGQRVVLDFAKKHGPVASSGTDLSTGTSESAAKMWGRIPNATLRNDLDPEFGGVSGYFYDPAAPSSQAPTTPTPAAPAAAAPVVEEDPVKRQIKLMLKRMNLANQLLFKTGEGAQLTIGEVGSLIENTENDIAKLEGKVSSSVKNKLASLKNVYGQMVSRAEKMEAKLEAEIEALDTVTDTDTETNEVADEPEKNERSLLDNLLGFLASKGEGGGAKPAPKVKKLAKKAARIPEPATYPYIHPVHGGFRSESEAELFERFVEGGHLISDFAANGFSPRRVEGITFSHPRKGGREPYLIELKQRLYAMVTDKFPLIPVPEGTTMENTLVAVGRMDGAGQAIMPLPVYADADGNVLSGFFTNDPRVTAYQMDRGFRVFIPKDLLNDPSFILNPSIKKVNKKTGEVERVTLHPGDAGVLGAGDKTLRGKSNYEPEIIEKAFKRGGIFAEPLPEYLEQAAPSPRKRVGIGYLDHLDDLMAEGSSIYHRYDKGVNDPEDVPLDVFTLNNYGFQLKKLGVTGINAEAVMTAAQADYLLQLKEFALAQAIDKSVAGKGTLEENARSVIYHVRNSLVTSNRGNAKEAAFLITQNYGIKGVDADSTLFKFGEFIHKKLTQEEDGFPLGKTHTFSYLVTKHGRNARQTQRAQGLRERNKNSVSLDKSFGNFAEAADSMYNLIGATEDVDIIAGAVPWEQTNADLLAAAIRTNEDLRLTFIDVINKSSGLNLAPDTATETVVDFANSLTVESAMGNTNLEVALRSTPNGRKIAALLADMGWLMPSRPGGPVLTPLSADLATAEERTMSVYRMAVRENPELGKEPESTEAAYKQLARLAAAHPDVLAMRPEITLLPWEVRTLAATTESRRESAAYRVELSFKIDRVADYIIKKQGVNVTTPETTGAFAATVLDPTSYADFIARLETRDAATTPSLPWDTSPDWDARAAAVEQTREAEAAAAAKREVAAARAAKKISNAEKAKETRAVAEQVGAVESFVKGDYLDEIRQSPPTTNPYEIAAVDLTRRSAKETPLKIKLLPGETINKFGQIIGPDGKRVLRGDSPDGFSSRVRFSRANDVRATAEMARELNNAEIAELGLVSNSPASVIAALEKVTKTGTRSQKLVARLLLTRTDLIRNVKFLIGDLNDPRFAGAFMRESNLVVLNLSGHNGRGVADVILHEYLHAITMNGMLGSMNAAQRAAMARISQLRSLTAARARSMGMDTNQFKDALSDDIEFLAYTLTDPSFQSLVTAATPPTQRSLLARIIDTILEFFGVTRDKAMSDAVMEVLNFAKMISSPTTFSLNYKRAATRRGMAMADGLTEVAAFAAIQKRLREMGTVSNEQIQFSPNEQVLQLDRDYLAAVESGDMETAQRMVDDARLLPRKAFYAGDIEIIRNPSSADYKQLAAAYRKEYPFDKSGDPTTRFTADAFGNRWIWRSDAGIHSFVEPKIVASERRQVSQNEFNWHMKNADPVTYDDAGNLIPLSQRFDLRSNDIRFALNEQVLAVPGTAAEIDEQVRFSPEERAQWQNMAKRARKEASVDTDLFMEQKFPEDSYEDSYELTPELNLRDGISPADGETGFTTQSREAWGREIVGILKRSGFDLAETNRRWLQGVKNKPIPELDYELGIVNMFFAEAGQPLMDWFSQDGAGYRIDVESARGVDREIEQDFKRSITHLLVGLDRNRLSGDPDRQTAVARIVKAYIEAFAPEADLDNMRKWFRDFFSESSPAQGVSVVVQGSVMDPAMGAKIAVEHYRQVFTTPKGQKFPQMPNVVGVLWREGGGSELQTLSKKGEWREAELLALKALQKTSAYSDVKFRDPFRQSGNVIPLSQRFNVGSDDIRFSPGSETGSGDLALDPVSEIESMLPSGVTLREDMDMRGEASVRYGETTINVNPEFLARRIAGLSADRARMVLMGIRDHELAHIAADRVVSTKDLADIATELGEARLAEIAEDYYSATGLTGQELAERIATDRKSGELSDVMIAAEWYRMELTRGVTGTTSEQDAAALRASPTLLGTVTRALKAFIGELTRLFQSSPSPATAAAISKGQRLLRNLMVDGVDALDIGPVSTDSDMDALASVLRGNDPVNDRVSYSVAVVSDKPGYLEKVTEMFRLYNLPEKLRKHFDTRSGSIKRLEAETLDFRRNFDKMRDAAIAGGVSMDTIRDLLGTTAPPITRADSNAIEDQLLTFAEGLDANLSQGKRNKLIEDKRESLKASKRIEFGNAFSARQLAAEAVVEEAGFGDLVAKARVFRADLNKYKADVGFDESNDVYLTRSFKFFTTEGWSKLARMGGKGVIDGREVDFDMLRAVAAESYRAEVEAEAAAETARGITVTNAEIDARVVAKLDDYLETLADLNASVDIKVSDGIRKDLNRLKPKSDIDESFLKLLGEHDDPLYNGINTLHRVGLMSANQKFRNEFASTALITGMASRRPQEGYEMVYASNMVNTVGPLAGLYFAKNVAGVLHETFGAGRSGFDSNSTQLTNKVWRGVSRLSGIAIFSGTQLGLGYWVRNSIGVPLLSAAQGVLINPFSAQTRASFVDTYSGSFRKLPTDEARRNRILRYIELNVLNDQSRGRVVTDLLRGFATTPEQDIQEIIADLEEARATKDAGGVFKRMMQRGAVKGLWKLVGDRAATVPDFLAALDSAIDGFGKVNMFEFELDVISRHYGDGMALADQEVLAAKKVKATMPGHTQVIDAVKSFQGNPLAAVFVPFARWKSEVFRTMGNTIPLAIDEIKVGGIMARRGVRRLVGFSATLAAGGTVIGTLATVIFRALAGEDEEEDEVVDKDGKVRKLSVEELAALREALPVWQRGHSLFAQILPGGKVQFVDMTYVLPHSQLTDIVSIVAEGIQTGKGVDASRLASYIGNEILGAQIAATALKETFTNRDDFGQPIYLESDSSATKFNNMLKHYVKGAVAPQIYKKGKEAFRSGQQNTKEMIIGEFLGVRPRTETLADIESRGFRNLKASLDEAVSIIGKASGSRGMSQDDIDEIVDRHQDALNQTQRRMSLFMHAMKEMGSTDKSLITSAKEFKFSDQRLLAAQMGYSPSWFPAKAWAQKAFLSAERGGEQDPREKVEMIMQSVRRKQKFYPVTDGGYGHPTK